MSGQFSYDYDTVRSVKEAIGILESQKFDVVVSDYVLGDGTAFDLFDRIKDTPGIIVTGAGDEEIAAPAGYDQTGEPLSTYTAKRLPSSVPT